MLNLMSNGRVPRKSTKQQLTPTHEPISGDWGNPTAAVSSDRARKLILEHRAWDGMRVLGHLDLRHTSIDFLPENLTCESLDISNCGNLTTLPQGLHVTRWIELAGSGITHLAPGHGFVLHWRGVLVDERILASSLTGQDILNTENVELRRVLIERLGYETFLQQVGGVVRDRDRDPGGERQLICIAFEDDEPLMILKVICPSTGHIHILRVPPYLRSCQEAAAWVAGFDNSNDYQPLIEA